MSTDYYLLDELLTARLARSATAFAPSSTPTCSR